jgi:hypothetical protein
MKYIMTDLGERAQRIQALSNNPSHLTARNPRLSASLCMQPQTLCFTLHQQPLSILLHTEHTTHRHTDTQTCTASCAATNRAASFLSSCLRRVAANSTVNGLCMRCVRRAWHRLKKRCGNTRMRFRYDLRLSQIINITRELRVSAAKHSRAKMQNPSHAHHAIHTAMPTMQNTQPGAQPTPCKAEPNTHHEHLREERHVELDRQQQRVRLGRVVLEKRDGRRIDACERLLHLWALVTIGRRSTRMPN